MGLAEGNPIEWKSPNFKLGFFFTAASLFVFLVAFASPYWLQTYHTVPYDFKNMGLWEICFSNYFFREDRYSEVFDGCYWSFAIELEFQRNIFNPGFFVMCQVFSVVVLVLLVSTVLIMSTIFLRCGGQHNWSYWILSTILSGSMGIATILLFVIMVTIGAKSGDRLWMPRADLVWLSWGYAFAVLADLLALVATIFFGKEAKTYWGSKAPMSEMFGFPMFRQGDAAMEPPGEGGSVFAY